MSVRTACNRVIQPIDNELEMELLEIEARLQNCFIYIYPKMFTFYRAIMSSMSIPSVLCCPVVRGPVTFVNRNDVHETDVDVFDYKHSQTVQHSKAQSVR